MAKEKCPKCGRISLRYRSINNDYICDRIECQAIFDKNLREMHIKGTGFIRDNNGNYYKVETKKENRKIFYTKIYFLEPEKTTLRGEYPKLRKDVNCKFPNRLSCNHEIGSKRCKYMKYERSSNNWICIYQEE